MKTDPRIGVLASVPGFTALRRRDLSRLAAMFDDVRVEPGEVLARQGRLGRELFLIAEGTAMVQVGAKTVEELGPGEFVGEIAMLEHSPHASDVTARTPMHLLVAGPRSAAELLHHPALLRRVAAQLAGRLRTLETLSGTRVRRISR
jgi:CRP-like cAMP-binding protein